ncbi:DUF166 domain-containing protein [Methanobacterium sp. SMA-27]|uniref:DUF166 domain-containing protein n=1 Tax=Methanobacterium sp. SMA-27 TaxID=1495336 RepID=UPI00064E8BBA|nr:DUF166 family protein [Methanobacterium sp. SMA-27]
MLKIAVVTDGPYGDRAFDTISKEFESDFIELEQPESMFMEDVEIAEEALESLKSTDIIISYILHPDLLLELVEQLHDHVEWIIVGAWKGEGFKNQIEEYDNVICPENICDLEESGDEVFNEFVSKFGKPIVEIETVGNKVSKVHVLRSSPCGSTFFVADEMVGEDVNNLPIKAGLKVQHYPCRASKMRLFVDECKKELAANFHRDAFEDAIERDKLKN